MSKINIFIKMIILMTTVTLSFMTLQRSGADTSFMTTKD